MARPRKPTAIKKLQGTLQPCRTNLNEPKPQTDIKVVSAPSWLNDVAKQHWNFAISQMPDGMVSSLDYTVFAMWADTVSKIFELEAILQHEGLMLTDEKTGKRVVNHVLKQQNELKYILKNYPTELGFTPASRSKVSITKSDSDNKNSFLDLLGYAET